MAREEIWENADGLAVGFGTRTVTQNSGSKTGTPGAVEEVVLNISDATLLSDTVSSTDDAIVQGVVIPADSLLLSAELFVTTAFTSGGSAVLDIGVYQTDGTIVDDDGVDAAIAVASLVDNFVVSPCDGALVGTVLANDSKIAASYDTAAFTAGAAKLVVRYIPKG